MGKRVLGDDPFAPKADGGKPGKPSQTTKAASKQGGKAKAPKPAKPAQKATKATSAPPKKERRPKPPVKADPPLPTVEEPSVPLPVEVVDAVAEAVVVDAVVIDETAPPPPAIPEPSAPPTPALSPEGMEGRAEYGPSIDVPRHRDEGEPAGLPQRIGLTLRTLEAVARRRLGAEPDYGGRQKPPLEFLWKRWRQLAMRDRSDVVDEFGRDPAVVDELAPFLEFFYTSWFRVQTQGIEHIPAEGRALLVGKPSGRPGPGEK